METRRRSARIQTIENTTKSVKDPSHEPDSGKDDSNIIESEEELPKKKMKMIQVNKSKKKRRHIRSSYSVSSFESNEDSSEYSGNTTEDEGVENPSPNPKRKTLETKPKPRAAAKRISIGDLPPKPKRCVTNEEKSKSTTVRRSTIKTPAKKGIKPWQKQNGKMIKGDILVPSRRLNKSEQRILVFQIVAHHQAKKRESAITIEEAYRILDQIKAEFKADREGYVRSILKSEGRDLEEPKKEEKQKESPKEGSDSSSDSEDDEWLDMEPVDAAVVSQLEVTIENKQVSGHDWWAYYLRQEVNKHIRKKWESTHKLHILCYFAHLVYTVKTILREEILPCLMFSQLHGKLAKLQQKDIKISDAKELVAWFKEKFKITTNLVQATPCDRQVAGDEATAKYIALAGQNCYTSEVELAALLFSLFVGLGATARICINTRPISRSWDSEREHLSEEQKHPKKSAKSNKSSQQFDYWVEYWNIKENRWICLNPYTGIVDDPQEIEKCLFKPIHYIFAIDNKQGIRDVSARYASDFCRSEFKQKRTEGTWLNRVLKSKEIASDYKRAKLEDNHFSKEMLARPLPVNLKDYKNHPLYVLERDLLKFQALYPPASEQKPLGEVRHGHKVYLRSTVYTLLPEYKWERLARSIKDGEKPYKVVKAIVNPMIPKEEREDKWMDVFGFWQTTKYKRLVVEDGIIPRNDYGNVALYQPSMCPIGAVHLNLPGLPQLARRLNRECVPTVTGWENGYYPIVEGACVLEEDKDLFIAEWKKADAERIEKEKKKKEERVMGHWKTFIQGMLRLNRIKTKFGHQENTEQKKKSKKKEVNEVNETVAQMPRIIDNTVMPVLQEFTLQQVMGL